MHGRGASKCKAAPKTDKNGKLIPSDIPNGWIYFGRIKPVAMAATFGAPAIAGMESGEYPAGGGAIEGL